MRFPRIAYISLWFPKPSETFIFREVKTLKDMGIPIRTFNLYAPLAKDLSPEMQVFTASHHFGLTSTLKVFGTLISRLFTSPSETFTLLKQGPFNGWRSFEGLGENIWAFCCGLILAQTFKEEKIEHIHAPWAHGPATAAWVASKLTNIPFSFAARAADVYPPEGALPVKIKDASFVRVNYDGNLPYLRSFARKDPDKIVRVYNALSLKPLSKPDKKTGQKLRLLAAGRFVGKKGFDVLLDACALLKKNDFDFSLTFAGDGSLRSKLQKQTQHLGLVDNVMFNGFMPHNELSRLMLESDALVVPSVIHSSGDRDGIPNVIMEACVHGLPVVASDVAGISEVIQNNITGYLVPQRDPAALASQLLKIAQNPEKAKRIAEQSEERVLGMFNPQENCNKLIELFAAHSIKENTEN